jgi:glycosyltransferase involved in cell wall biosynthesis
VTGPLLYDLSAAQPIGSSPVSGGGEYAARVFRRLVEEPRTAPILALRDTTRTIAEELLALARDRDVEIVDFARTADVLRVIAERSVATFYSALPLRYRRLRFPAGVRFVYTIHGLRPLELLSDRYEHRYFYSPRSVVRWAAARVLGRGYQRARRREFAELLRCAPDRRVIAASEHTRTTLLAEFPFLDPASVTTLYSPAAAADPPSDDTILAKLGLEPDGFFLLICGNRWGKNPLRALQALEGLMVERDLGKKVVVTGRGRARYLRRYQGDPRFVVTDYLPRAGLEALYRHAFCFVFPTLNEGFGYPPLECMKHGTPVITSPICSLPELLGDAALWADPLSVIELRARILRVLLDADLRADLARRGAERARLVRERQDCMLGELVALLRGAKP